MLRVFVALAVLGAVAMLLLKPTRPAAPESPVLQVFGAPGTADGQFNRPRSVACDGQHVFVIDLTDRVQVFDLATARFLRLWRLPDIRIGRPQRIVCAPDGTLYITNTHYGEVLHYDRDGRMLDRFGKEGREAGQLYYPVGFCVMGDRLAVSEYGGHDRIQWFSPEGAFRGGFGRSGTGPGEFMRPEGLARSPDGRLLVADAANHRIQVFTPEGVFLSAFGRAGTGDGALCYPYDLAVEPSGRIVVLEYGSHRISFWRADGSWLGAIGSLGSGPGQLANPWGLCLLDDGTALVTNSDNHRVERWRLPPWA